MNITSFFFFNDTATTEIYTLSLHDALPICTATHLLARDDQSGLWATNREGLLNGWNVSSPVRPSGLDRKSTRLNSSHANISYAVFCLKKKKKKEYMIYKSTTSHIY